MTVYVNDYGYWEIGTLSIAEKAVARSATFFSSGRYWGDGDGNL